MFPNIFYYYNVKKNETCFGCVFNRIDGEYDGSDNKKHVLKRGERESHKNLKSTSVHSITREKCQTLHVLSIHAMHAFHFDFLINF